MKILNLTQHNATKDQLEAGVVEMTPEDKTTLVALLNFATIPTTFDIIDRADKITALAKKYDASKVMIGGAPFFMSMLEKTLVMNNITPMYAFSERKSIEIEKDGEVTKTSVFAHVGFVNLY